MTKFCDDYPGLCFYFAWCALVTLFLIVYNGLYGSSLTNDQYLSELQKINYKDIDEANARYNEIQNNALKYANTQVHDDCSYIWNHNSRQLCNAERNRKINKFKNDYLDTQITSNEKKLIQLYESQNINLKLKNFALWGYFGIPIIFVTIILTPWWAR